MKTQKKTLRGIVTSSVLTLALAGGMLPIDAVAFAAETAGQQINQSQTLSENAGDESLDASTADSNETDVPANAEKIADGVYKVDESNVEVEADESATPAADSAAPATTTPQYTTEAQGHTSATLRLESQAQPAAGVIEYGGLAYTIDPEDPNTAKVTGLATDKPKGEVQVQTQVASDGKLYQVTAIEFAGGGGHNLTASDPAADEDASSEVNPYKTEFTQPGQGAPDVTSFAIPAGITSVDPAFFQLFPNLKAIAVAEDSESYKSYNGMLFTSDLSNLLLVPEGMEGNAVLPESLASVPAYAFSRCTKLSAISLSGSTGASFTCQDGILYSIDKRQLVAAPAGMGTTVVVASECTQIAEGAFWGNLDLKTIVANGQVEDIAQSAFSQKAIENATVAINVDPAAYEAAKLVWETAGFTHFAESAQPGDQITPVQGSGFAFALLDDFTLAVSWTGDDPAPAKLEVPAYGILEGVQYKVSAIADEGFAGQTDVQQVVLPDGLIDIGAGAFEGATSLNTVSVPGSVTAIGSKAFAGASDLVALELNEGLTSIGDAAFQGIAQKAIVLPASVKAVGDYAFANSPNLRTVIALGTVSMVGSNALGSAEGLNLYVPYSESEAYAWTAGLPASGNHLLPYGVKLSDETINVTVDGESADLFEGGYLKAPGDFQVSYAYKAKPISISEDGKVEAKDDGTSNVEVALTLGVPKQVVNGIVSKDAKLTPAAYNPNSAPTVQTADVVESVQPVTLAATATVASTRAVERAANVPTKAMVELSSPIASTINIQYGSKITFTTQAYITGVTSIGAESDGSLTIRGDQFIYRGVVQISGNNNIFYITPSLSHLGWSRDGRTPATESEIEVLDEDTILLHSLVNYNSTATKPYLKVEAPSDNVLSYYTNIANGTPTTSKSGTISASNPVNLAVSNSLSNGASFSINGSMISSNGQPNSPYVAGSGNCTFNISATSGNICGYKVKGEETLLPDGNYYVQGASMTLVPVYGDSEPNKSGVHTNTTTTVDNQITIKRNGQTLSYTRTQYSYYGSDDGAATSGTISSDMTFYYVTKFTVDANGTVTIIGRPTKFDTQATSKYVITPSSNVKYWDFTGGTYTGVAKGIYPCDTSKIALTPRTENINLSDAGSYGFDIAVPAGGTGFTVKNNAGTTYTISAGSKLSFIANTITLDNEAKKITFYGWKDTTETTAYLWEITCSASSYLGVGSGNTITTAVKENVMASGRYNTVALKVKTYYAQYNATSITFDMNGKTATNSPTLSKSMTLGSAGTVTIPKTGGYTFSNYASSTNGTDSFFARSGTSSTSARTTWTCTLPAVTLYAKWTANEVRINFHGRDNDGGTVMNAQVITTDSSTKTLTANAFTKSGYTFVAWANSENTPHTVGTLGGVTLTDGADLTPYLASTTSASTTVDIYAIWLQKVTINFNGGTPANPTTYPGTSVTINIYYGDTFNNTLTAIAWTREGYVSKGIYTAQTGGEQVFTNTFVHTAGKYWDSAGKWIWSGVAPTLWIQWSPHYVTITYNANGGVGTMESHTVYYAPLTTSPAPDQTLKNNTFTREGYSFVGWATSATGEKEYSDGADMRPQVSLTEEKTELNLYAVWEKDSHIDVTFHANDGTDRTATQRLTKAANSLNTLESLGWVYPGRFLGWALGQSGADAGRVSYRDGHVVSFPTSIETLDLYAVWAPYGVTITFDGNGADGGSMSSQTISHTDADKTLKANAFTRQGYTFNGWTTDSAGLKKEFDDRADVSSLLSETEDRTVTLYAVWQAGYIDVSINYYLQNADDNEYTLSESMSRTQSMLVGQSYHPDTFGTVTYYTRNTLKGDVWAQTIKGDGTSKFDIYWDRNRYDLTYAFSGDAPEGIELPAKARVKHGATVTLPEVNAVNGYTFKGWSINDSLDLVTDATFLMPTRATTVTGVWEHNATYTVKYDKGYEGPDQTGPVDTNVYQPGDLVTLPDAGGFTRSGYVFLGWSTTSGHTNTGFRAGQQVPLDNWIHNGTVTMYAVWGPQVNVSSPITPAIKLSVKPGDDGITGTLTESQAANADFFSSQTPEAVLVSSMQCAPVEGQEGTIKVFGVASLWPQVKVTLDDGDGARVELAIDEDLSRRTFSMVDEGKFVIPASGRLPLTVDLNVPDSVPVTIVDGQADVARLMFTFQLAKETGQQEQTQQA